MAIQDFTAGQILTAAQMDSLQANDYNWTVSTKTANYTLVAADKGTRVVMNAAGATTITVNDSLFNAGDTLFIQNIGAGTCTITAGTATVTTAGSLALAQWGGGTLYFTSASAAIFFSGGGTSYGTATGGSSSSITVGGINYTLLSFTSTGTLTVTKSGLFDVFLWSGGGAGGGSGASASSIGSGGGAGGRYVLLTGLYLDANQTITIGAGGAGSSGRVDGARGAVTTLGSLVTTLSAGGGRSLGTNLYTSTPSGGNVGIDTQTFPAIVDTTFGGYAGGAGNGSSNGAGGGGGATAVGASATSNSGAAGGAGYDVSSFIGVALYKGGGGGGGGSTAGGAGGSSVGGAGGTAAGSSASANTASGGGGSCETTTAAGGSGGSGIAYIRFKV